MGHQLSPSSDSNTFTCFGSFFCSDSTRRSIFLTSSDGSNCSGTMPRLPSRAVYGPCPPKAVLGPAFTPGSGFLRLVLSRPFTGVLLVTPDWRPLNGPEIRTFCHVCQPGVNAGPNTA